MTSNILIKKFGFNHVLPYPKTDILRFIQVKHVLGLCFLILVVHILIMPQQIIKVTKTVKSISGMNYGKWVQPKALSMERFTKMIPEIEYLNNPCWYKKEFIAWTLRDNLIRMWRKRNYSKQLDTPNMKEVLVNTRMALYDKKQSTLRCVPSFYLLSPAGSAMNDMYLRIIQHPEIEAPSKKEIDFWPKILTQNLETYADFFNAASRNIRKNHYKITFDASTSTFFQNEDIFSVSNPDATIAEYIYMLSPKVKIFVFLRNPVNRLYSDYWSHNINPNPEDFDEKVKKAIEMFNACLSHSSLKECVYNKNFIAISKVTLRLGIYWVFLEGWLRFFPPTQRKLFKTEDYIGCEKCYLQRIFGFLSLNISEPPNSSMYQPYILSPVHRDHNEPMLENTHKLLTAFYKPYNEKLSNITGRRNYLFE